MADAKITELSVMVAPALTDLMPVVDDVAGTPETQAIQLQTLLLIVDLLTEEATVDGAADFLLMYDTSAGGVRKVLPDNLSTPTHVHAAGDVTSGTFTDARVAESNVTQHEAALTITESQISDLGTYATTAYVDSAVAGLYDHKGAYNASTNSPDLDTSPSGILKGDAYTVSVAGTFFAVSVEAGDVLIADQDDPTLSTHWTIVNRNIDSSAFAAASHTHAASDIDSGTFTDARVAESNVTQHAAAITAGDLDIASLTAEATVDGAADYLVMLDATGAVTRKVLIDDLPTSSGDTLPVTDTTGIAKGSVDSTKVVRLEVDGLTTATTRVLTVQDADGTICYTGHVHSASDTTSGQFADARIAESNVTQHEAALSITESQISDFGSYSTVGHAHAASDITSGTLAHERGGLEADVSAYAGVALIDGGTTSEIKYNLTATTDPGVGDDSDDGYSVGSRWINVTLDKEFVCLDATVGAAVWTETTGAGGGGSAGLTITRKTAAYNAVDGDLVVCDCTSGGFNVVMPASPSTDARIGVYLENGSFSLPATVQGNGNNLGEFGTSLAMRTPGELIVFQYDGNKWVLTANGLQTSHELGGLEADVSGYNGVPLIDGGTTSELKYNLTATTDPAATDDSGEGYTIGSRWVNVTLDKEFVCLDATIDAAAWTETTAAAGSGSGLDCWEGSCGTYSGENYAAWKPAGSSPRNAIFGPLGAGYIAAHVPDGTSTGGNQRGDNSVDLQTSRTAATQIASGLYSVLGGGIRNTADGYYSVAPGGRQNTADGDYSVVFGYHADDRGLLGSVVHASGGLGGSGKTQSRTMQLRIQTSNATAKTMTSNNGAASTTNIPVLPDGSAYRFTAEILGRRQDGSDLAAYTITGLISRGTGAGSTTLDASSVTTEHEDDAGWSVAAVADTTNGGLAIQATGDGDVTGISWLADVRTQEIEQ